ncbi:hypothetical protein KSS93_03275 [Pseudomonas xanthosomatis]|uniref:hypothetical protein n=1 Tax=Pseudomonas xanthosomatis TaxID=2842356 RepID=UPI001C3D444B|nr:hypothetical protein [Pseudomonas xanthosomatis]QXH46952.1 hypothetical protein KSS93_03275 [Pseudomonas xanthosomatis]
MPSIAPNPLDLVTTLPDALRQQLAGKSNLLMAVRQPLADCTQQLRSLFNQAPSLRQTLHDRLQAHLQADPTQCGLRHADSQVSLLTFAARIMASPVYANPFLGWSTWGFADTSPYATLSAADWVQVLAPLVNASHAQALRNYWEARMPGSWVSRHAHTCELLRQHFKRSLDLAYGLGTLDNNHWLQGGQPEPRYALLEWQLPSGAKLPSTAALLIGPGPDAPGWLIYLPSLSNSVLAFETRERLCGWVFENRSFLWSDPRSPIPTGSLDDVLITEQQADGFEAWLQVLHSQQEEIAEHHLLQACQLSKTDPLDWLALQTWEAQRQSVVRQGLSTTLEAAIEAVVADDTALALEEVHFACLPTHLPVGWRQHLIERQEALLEQYLDGQTDPSSAKVTSLRERQAALEQLQDAQDTALLERPEGGTPDELQAQLDPLSERLCQALLQEARLQHAVGELSDVHLSWVEHLVDRPEASLQRPVQACALELVGADRTWPLSGYMTFRALPGEDDETAEPSVLLYRPGQRGGLMAFADEPSLVRSLQATLQGAWPDALLETAGTGDDAQLQALLTHPAPFSFNHPTIAAHFMAHCVKGIIDTLPAATPRELVRQRLCVSENRARSIAFARLAHSNRSSHFQAQLTPLKHLGADQLAELAAEVDALQGALLASASLLSRSLPSRTLFTRQLLDEHLRQAFGVQHMPQITLNIADSVTLEKEVTGQSALSGAGSRDVPVFSKARSDVSLEAFILTALDDSRRLRLGNAIIRFNPANPVLEQALTPAYIASLITQLDAAGRYEQCITQAYLGLEQETDWQVQWRQEVLRRPYEHRLRLLALSRPASLSADGQRLLERFCREQVEAEAPRSIAYHTLALRPGAAADGSSDQVGLSGITVIEDAGGPALLYLPEAPNGQVISQHASGSAACEALQNMALDRSMASYLASRTQSGNPDEHASYIDMALQKGFNAFIALGTTRSESLPTYASRLEMGERVRKHRASSRSQADLALAAPQVFDHYFFLGLRLALGVLPGASTAVAMYDGWQTAQAAVNAFGQGDVQQGLLHLTSLLQSLSDAILTLAPLAASAGKPVLTPRLLARQRQHLAPLTPMSAAPKARPSPFAGYEAELPAGPLLPSSLAQGAGVFEHRATQQSYILRNTAWYAVDWDPTYATWRLKPQGGLTYRQPVRLSAQGAWETPGRLNGLLVDTGLQGGGGALTTLYNHGVAYWRAVLRRQPPALTAQDINDELERIPLRLKARRAAYKAATEAVANDAQADLAQQRAAIAQARQPLSEELTRNIEFYERTIAYAQTHRSTLGRAEAKAHIAYCQQSIRDMSVLEMNLVSTRLALDVLQVTVATKVLQAQTGHTMTSVMAKRLIQDILLANKEMIETLTEVEHIAIRHHARLATMPQSAKTAYLKDVDDTKLTVDLRELQLTRASILSKTLIKASAAEHPQLGVFMPLLNEQTNALSSTLFSHIEMPNANLTRAQERQFLSSAKTHYARYLNIVTAWEDSFQDMLSADEAQALRQLLRQLNDDIEATLARAAAQQRPAPGPARGASRPRLFDTVEGPMIGIEHVERGHLHMRINQPNSDQPHSLYTRNAADQWQPYAPARTAPSETLQNLVGVATAQLNDLLPQQAKLRRYQTPQAIPADLEDIAQGHAQRLRFIAGQIRLKAGSAISAEHTALTQRLEAGAEQMKALGRQLRIAQTKATGKPAVGHLQYLVEQQEVQLAWSRVLKPKLDRQGNPAEYLEEYLVRDRTTQQVLWYAHFHFRKQPAQGFRKLEAGHLKLASERDLGEGAWRGSLSEAQATQLFGNLRPAA